MRALIPPPRDELFNGEIFYTLRKAQIVIGSGRGHYNAVRSDGALSDMSPVPKVVLPTRPASLRLPTPPTTLAQMPRLD